MFQPASTALFHEHIKAYTIMGISATVERASRRRPASSTSMRILLLRPQNLRCPSSLQLLFPLNTGPLLSAFC
jgi:hypothetical protein